MATTSSHHAIDALWNSCKNLISHWSADGMDFSFSLCVDSFGPSNPSRRRSGDKAKFRDQPFHLHNTKPENVHAFSRSEMNCKLSLPIPNRLSTCNDVIPGPPHSARMKRRADANDQESPTGATISAQTSTLRRIKFQTLESCKLGIARYPDFEYDARGGSGVATGAKESSADAASYDDSGGELLVDFDVGSLYIPPLTGATTRFLGLPLPPFLKIEIVPEALQGTVNGQTGRVELGFKARFWFSIGGLYRAPPLVVETTLTSEESEGTARKGKGERLDGDGKCRLVGVATVDPVDDFLLDSFLGLPTECIADLNARISISSLD